MITKIEDLKKSSGGSEVELPGFVSGETITVKLCRPSLLKLIESGSIPNPLLAAASELFGKGVFELQKTKGDFGDTAKVVLQMAKAALIEPTYEELEAADIDLTDSQLLYIYNFVQSGVNVMKVFREEQGTNKNNKPVAVPKKTAK